MQLELYRLELEVIEVQIRDLLLELKIKIPFLRFINFSTLFLYLNKAPYKLIASEIYENNETLKRTTIKVQVSHLGVSKLSKMKEEDIKNRLSKLIELDGLFRMYKSIMEAYQSNFDVLYSKYKINFILSIDSQDDKSKESYRKYLEHKKHIYKFLSTNNEYLYKRNKEYTVSGNYNK